MMMMSSACLWSSYVMYVLAGCSDWCVGLYPLLPIEIHLSSGSVNIVKRNGERMSRCIVPLCMGYGGGISMRSHIVCAGNLL